MAYMQPGCRMLQLPQHSTFDKVPMREGTGSREGTGPRDGTGPSEVNSGVVCTKVQSFC